jgi:hypothetical protein
LDRLFAILAVMTDGIKVNTSGNGAVVQMGTGEQHGMPQNGYGFKQVGFGVFAKSHIYLLL